MNSKSSVSNPSNQVPGMTKEEIKKKRQEIFDQINQIKKLIKPSRPDPFRPPIPHLKEPPKLQKPEKNNNQV